MGEVINHPANGQPSARVFRVEGIRSRQRRPARLSRLWQDVEVRRALIDCYGETSIDGARERVLEVFGAPRCPSRSSIHRFWQELDVMFPKR